MRETVCLLGKTLVERLSIDTVVAESGWSFEHAGNLSQLKEMGVKRDIVAVLIDAGTLAMPPKAALQAVSNVLPKALPVICHKASEPIQWTELAQAGAFHALLLPLRASELRQTLGFVWQARRRSHLVTSRPRPLVSSRWTQAASIPA